MAHATRESGHVVIVPNPEVVIKQIKWVLEQSPVRKSYTYRIW